MFFWLAVSGLDFAYRVDFDVGAATAWIGRSDGRVLMEGSASRPLGHIVDAADHPLLRGAGWAPFFTVADLGSVTASLDRTSTPYAAFPHGTGHPALVAKDPSGAAFGLVELALLVAFLGRCGRREADEPEEAR